MRSEIGQDGSRRPWGRLGRLSLLWRFGITSAVCIALLGAALGLYSRAQIERRALDNAEHIAQLVGDLTVRPLLSAADFERGLRPAQLDELDDALASALAKQPVSRVKVFGANGTIVYSDHREIVGERSEPSPLLRTALAGGVASKIEVPHGDGHDHESELGSLLEVYVPVRYGDEEINGAFELYLPYDPIATAVAEDLRGQVGLLAAGLALLFLVLFRTVATASIRLRTQLAENEWLAHHDGLTGLPNRALFADRLQQAVLRAQRHANTVAVLLINLDRFKEINDTLGHDIGDRLLRQVGARLADEVRGADTVARLGGDEFAILLAETEGLDAAGHVGQRLREAVELPFDVDGVTLEVGASVGIACYPDHADGAGQLLQRADVAMYAAKLRHLDVAVYEPEHDDYTPARLALFGELRRGIDAGELVLHYQPKSDLNLGRVTGLEVLVRWQHPARGLLPPGEFVHIAEQTGLVKPLTSYVLDQALRQCRVWRDEGLDVAVAINLSMRSVVDAELPDEVARALAAHAMPPEAVEFEITESTVMADASRALAVLVRLRDMGVKLAIDDYGTGYSSLAYLRGLPIDTLKIDKSFVIGMDDVPGNAVIVRSTIELARNLGLSVVAEGVENATVLELLGDLGCDAAQGYYLSRPGPATSVPDEIAAVERRLRRNRQPVPRPG